MLAAQISYKIDTRNDRGRCFLSSDPLEIGSNIVIEEPYAMIILGKMSLECCAFCGKICTSTIYESTAEDRAKYCSQDCLVRDFNTHKHEVEPLKIIYKVYGNSSGVDLDRIRLLLRIAAKRKQELESQCKEIEETIYSSSVDSFAAVLALQRGFEDEDNDKQLLSKLAKMMILYKLPLSDQDVRHLWSAFRCNAHYIVDSKNRAFALGLFPLVSMLNHSCQPNCTKYFESSPSMGPPRLVIRTLRAVAAGEELLYSYVPLYQSTASRRKALQHSYGFICSCERCLRHQEEAASPLEGSPIIREADIESERRSNSQSETAIRKLNCLLEEFPGLLSGPEGDGGRVLLLRRFLRFVGQDLTYLSGCLMPQNRILLQFHICLLNLVVNLPYSFSEATSSSIPSSSSASSLSSSIFKMEEGAGRDEVDSLRLAIGSGVLALGCLYEFLGSECVEKETADVEAAIAKACSLLLSHCDLSSSATPKGHPNLDPIVSLLFSYLIDRRSINSIVRDDEKDAANLHSFYEENKIVVLHFLGCALPSFQLGGERTEASIIKEIGLLFSERSTFHTKICRSN